MMANPKRYSEKVSRKDDEKKSGMQIPSGSYNMMESLSIIKPLFEPHFKSIFSRGAEIRAKLEISQPEDESEMQADEMAESFMDGDSEQSQDIISQHTPEVSRESEGDAVQTSNEFDQQLESTKGQGQKIDAGTKSELEEHTGTDLSGVNVHTNSQAHDMSESINAKAFTHGQDIYFKNGNYNTNSNEGKELLAHEVTHVVQHGTEIKTKIQRQQGENLLKGTKPVDKPEEKVKNVISAYTSPSASTGGTVPATIDLSYLQNEVLDKDLKVRLIELKTQSQSAYVLANSSMATIANLAKEVDLEWLGSMKQGLPNPNFNFDFNSTEGVLSTKEARPNFLYGIDQFKENSKSGAIQQIASYIEDYYPELRDAYVEKAAEADKAKAAKEFSDMETKAAKWFVDSEGNKELYPFIPQIDAGQTYRPRRKNKDFESAVNLRRYETSPEEFAANALDSYNLSEDQLITLKEITVEPETKQAIDSIIAERELMEKSGSADNPFPQQEYLGKDTDPLYKQFMNALESKSLDGIKEWWKAEVAKADTIVTDKSGQQIPSSVVALGSVKAPSNVQAREVLLRYSIFYTMLHEFFHFNTHYSYEFEVMQMEAADPSGMTANILIEGVTDLFAFKVWQEFVQKLAADPAKRGVIEGWWSDPNSPPPDNKIVPFDPSLVFKPSLYSETYPAFKLMNDIGGIQNLKAAYFLGHTELLGIGNAKSSLEKSGLTASDKFILHVVMPSSASRTNYSTTLVEVAIQYGFYETISREDFKKLPKASDKEYDKMVNSTDVDLLAMRSDQNKDIYTGWHGEMIKLKNSDLNKIVDNNTQIKWQKEEEGPFLWRQLLEGAQEKGKGKETANIQFPVLKIPTEIIPK